MIPPHQPGNVQTDTIPMRQDYLYQVWFDLGTGAIVSSNVKTASDLGFDCSPGGWKVILNTADFMYAADLGVVPFGIPQDTAGARWRFDKSDGNPDSTAIGQWWTLAGSDTVSNGHVFAVNRGLDEAGNSLGFYQVVFDSLKNGVYYFRSALLNGESPRSGSLSRDTLYGCRWYSLFHGAPADIEPPKANWDLLFTQYTTMLYTDLGEPYPYLVTGVLLNPGRVAVAQDTTLGFASVTLADAFSLSYSDALDAIGYEWKRYDFDAGVYTVDYQKTYVIRTADGRYYKLRFVGFYNAAGDKGYPVIEFSEL
jgi:hypothetical protein